MIVQSIPRAPSRIIERDEKMIKSIFFDLDGVLFHHASCERFALESAFQTYGRKLMDKEIQLFGRINSKLWAQFARHEVDREYVLYQRFAIFMQEIGFNAPSRQIGDLFIHYFGEAAFLEPGAMTLVQELSAKYPLFVITNGLQAVIEKKIKKAGIVDYFSDIYTGDRAGFSKPSPEFFRYCFKSSGYSNSEILVVGDSLLSDISGGNQVGSKTCWYNAKYEKNMTKIIPDYEISELVQLNDILM